MTKIPLPKMVDVIARAILSYATKQQVKFAVQPVLKKRHGKPISFRLRLPTCGSQVQLFQRE